MRSFIMLTLLLGFAFGCGPPKGIVPDPFGVWDGAHKRRQEAYIAANPDLDENTINAIRSSKVKIGMSEGALIASWGEPCEVNTRVGKSGVRKQFVYGVVRYGCTSPYVYVDDGVVTSWSD